MLPWACRRHGINHLAALPEAANNARAMAHEPKKASPPADTCTEVRRNEPPVAVMPPELPLFRFSLRHLFWFVAVVSTLMAGVVAAKGPTAVVLLLAALVVMAHVVATAIGNRLRAHADDLRAWESAAGCTGLNHESVIEQTASRSSVRLGPRSPWHEHGNIALPWLSRLVIVAVVVGGLSGALLLRFTIGHRTSPAGIVVGAVSIAVLCGWFAFLAGSFYGIFRHGLREAVAEQKKDEVYTPDPQ